jgi:hypothetical protein
MGLFSWLNRTKADGNSQNLSNNKKQSSPEPVSPSLPRKNPSATPAEWVSLDDPQPMLTQRLGIGGTRTLPLRAMWRGRSRADLQKIGRWINEAPTSADAALNLAVERFRYREWSDASWWLKLAAEQGNTAAKAELAALHIRGLAMIADPAQGQAMLAECNGIMPGLLLNDPTDFGNSFDGKVPMRVVIHKNVYDQNNMDTWEFFAAPEGETFMIEFNMNDEIELTGWSEPVWVEFGNGPSPGYECFSGFLRYTSPTTAFLSPSLYAKRKEEFRARCARGA